MAKSRTVGPVLEEDVPAPSGAGELIVQLQADSPTFDEATPSFTRSEKIDSVQNILKDYNASLVPVFGIENRAVVSSPGQRPPSMDAISDLSGFYKVEATGDLQEIANSLLEKANVAAAYVKPPA